MDFYRNFSPVNTKKPEYIKVGGNKNVIYPVNLGQLLIYFPLYTQTDLVLYN